ALAMALNDFDGTVMLVSHDRALLRSVCEDFWMVGRGKVGPFDGDLDDYQNYLLEESKRLRELARLADSAPSAPEGSTEAIKPPADGIRTPAPGGRPSAAAETTPVAAAPSAPVGKDGREQRKLDAQARQLLAEKTRPLRKELEQIDKQLAALSAERAALEDTLSRPATPSEIAECGRKLKANHDETARLEERWLEISASLQDMAT
ncbi:MAG: ABC transporter, partial [Acidovorax sp.]